MGKVNIVRASAGSGKTYRLALEYIVRVLCEPTLYRHILAVTFTNKETEEMKERILGNINRLAHGVEDDFMADVLERSELPLSLVKERAAEVLNLILHDYDSFAVLTIDKFFQRIVRSFVRELGIDINYNLELKTDTLLDLFCGAGSIGLSMADACGELIGIEIIDSAVLCARENAAANGRHGFHKTAMSAKAQTPRRVCLLRAFARFPFL